MIVIATGHRAVAASLLSVLFSPDVKDKLEKTGNEPVASTPEEFVAFMRTEIDKWVKVVKAANIRVD